MLNYYSIIVGVPGYAVPYACTAATSLFVVGTVLRVFGAPSMLGFRGIYSGEFGDCGDCVDMLLLLLASRSFDWPAVIY